MTCQHLSPLSSHPPSTRDASSSLCYCYYTPSPFLPYPSEYTPLLPSCFLHQPPLDRVCCTGCAIRGRIFHLVFYYPQIYARGSFCSAVCVYIFGWIQKIVYTDCCCYYGLVYWMCHCFLRCYFLVYCVNIFLPRYYFSADKTSFICIVGELTIIVNSNDAFRSDICYTPLCRCTYGSSSVWFIPFAQLVKSVDFVVIIVTIRNNILHFKRFGTWFLISNRERKFQELIKLSPRFYNFMN